ncbi:SNF2-related protein [Streptomyces sp. NBC_00378]|uniref:SNF2-related protein n=1 Tax=unclassified Streptomyces TaxID=2593676 RepID=UPI0022560697|nr:MULTISPECIES: SNF2-related protein [unclassified Streptomyces]MCX5110034.1 SNF2-related protein [Streptomyces sp. NBC_00378]
MPRTNLLIADDVGLGKTIEAGLVMQELMLRHRARTMLIVCPSGLTLQWQDEMRDKFGLDFRIVNSALRRAWSPPNCTPRPATTTSSPPVSHPSRVWSTTICAANRWCSRPVPWSWCAPATAATRARTTPRRSWRRRSSSTPSLPCASPPARRRARPLGSGRQSPPQSC